MFKLRMLMSYATIKKTSRMKLILLIFSILLSNAIYSQSAKDSLLQKDISSLVEEMEFMYGYDQTMREYTIFKTFNKSETDRIENLP